MQPTNDLEVLRRWIGRVQESEATIDAAQAARLADTLDRPPPADGDPLPPLWHFAFHLASVPLADVGPDGHPRRGGFLPPVALPRRMWAGGRFTFHGPLRVGDRVTKTSTVTDVEAKVGRSGELVFVTVRHELATDGEPRVTEEQDLVYRDHPLTDAPTPEPSPAPTDAEWTERITPSEVMLFRYSALTFNGHRIHYDRPYATAVEGYRGLVVHGPMTATLLAGLAGRRLGSPLSSFAFRGTAPLFDGAPFTIAGRPTSAGAELWAAAPDGTLAMSATATA